MKRTIVELLHIATGVAGTVLIASVAAWGVPHSARTIWDVAYAAMLVVAFMGAQPLRLAWQADREASRGRSRADG